MRSDSSGGWYSIAHDGDTSATIVTVGAGSVSGPSIDIRERPRSFCMLCKRQRAESAGLRCIGHEPWSAPCAQVQTMSPADALLMDRRTAGPATTDTWTNSHATATGTSRRRIFATSADQLSAGLKGRQATHRHRRQVVAPVQWASTTDGVRRLSAQLFTMVPTESERRCCVGGMAQRSHSSSGLAQGKASCSDRQRP